MLEVVSRVLPFHQRALAKNVLDDAPPAVRYCMEIAADAQAMMHEKVEESISEKETGR